MGKKIRVVIADDSALMRKKISEILNRDPDIEVVAAARDGFELLDLVQKLKPDVVTLDIEMPVLNGLDALGYIMSEFPTPCVMISAYVKQNSVETIRALEFGAVDFVTKPGGVVSADIESVSAEIISKVKLAAEVPPENLRLLYAEKTAEQETIIKKPSGVSKVFVIASSTGGTQALATILPSIKADIKAAILVVQHMPEGFTNSLAERLNWQSKISVVEAEDKMPIRAGTAIVAKGGWHMEVRNIDGSPCVSLTSSPHELGLRPCANVTMRTAAACFRDICTGVVLTGIGSDGTAGARAVKEFGGVVIAQDEKSSVIYGMPKSAFEAGVVDKVLPLLSIASEMEKLSG